VKEQVAMGRPEYITCPTLGPTYTHMHTWGFLKVPEMNQQQNVSSRLTEKMRSNCFKLPFPFASSLSLSLSLNGIIVAMKWHLEKKF
jgi:hypothetical protein